MFHEHKHRHRQPGDSLELPAELAALERQLAHLSPAPLAINRDRLMFEAGRAAVEARLIAAPDRDGRAKCIAGPSRSGRAAHDSRNRFWPLATATMTAATLLLSAMLVRQSHRRPNESPTVHVLESPRPAVDVSTVGENVVAANFAQSPLSVWELSPRSGYLGIRNVALTFGLPAVDFATGQTNGGNVDDGSPPPETARELLHQLLPEAARANPSRS